MLFPPCAVVIRYRRKRRACRNSVHREKVAALMRRFPDPPSALDYVVDSLIPKGAGYIVNVIGPAEELAAHAATLQIVDQHKVYGDGETGLTLYLPFDSESATHESFALFKEFSKRVAFDDVTRGGIPTYARRFGTDARAALHVLAAVLNEVFEYPLLTTFKCEVYEG